VSTTVTKNLELTKSHEFSFEKIGSKIEKPGNKLATPTLKNLNFQSWKIETLKVGTSHFENWNFQSWKVQISYLNMLELSTLNVGNSNLEDCNFQPWKIKIFNLEELNFLTVKSWNLSNFEGWKL
jgi:uncharacterized protein YjbI with pentapeptide repeats